MTELGREIGGVYAAVLTPRTAVGELDEACLRELLEFLLGKGISGFAINGATGEFCLTTEAEFARLLAVVAEATRGRGRFLAGIGAAGARQAIRLGRMAAKAGAEALLLPMPYFFPYAQADLKAFCMEVARGVEAPVLLYNLPRFTSELEPGTSLELMRESGGLAGGEIIGIKDSSGSLVTVRRMTQAGMGARRLIGNDEVLAYAIEERVLDGVVSGVACVLPELMGRMYAAGMEDCAGEEFGALKAELARFIAKLGGWPTPWGLKVIAEARGLVRPTYPMPLSQGREAQRAALLQWFEEHRAGLLAE